MDHSSKWRDLIWGYAAQAMNIGGALFLLPVLLKRLSTNEIGAWFVLTTVYSLIVAIDFGFSASISRNITYVLSGAKTLLKKGISQDKDFQNPSSIDKVLLQKIILSSKLIYGISSFIVFLILVVLGSLYFMDIAAPIGTKEHNLLLWVFNTLACVFNLYFGYINAVLFGFGKITESFKIIFFSRLAFVILGILFLLMDFGLFGLVCSSALMVIIARLLSMFIYNRALEPFGVKEKVEVSRLERKELFHLLWFNTFRTGLISFGTFLVMRANVFVSSKFVGLSETASYGLTLQIFAALVGLSQVAFNNSLPALNTFRIRRDHRGFLDRIFFAMKVSLGTYILGVILLLMFGTWLLSFINGNTSILPFPQLLFLSIVLLLEVNHNNFTSIISTKNEIPYMWPYLFAGFFIISFSIFLTQATSWGLWCLLLAQGFVQLAYNNWKWPLLVWKELKEL